MVKGKPTTGKMNKVDVTTTENSHYGALRQALTVSKSVPTFCALSVLSAIALFASPSYAETSVEEVSAFDQKIEQLIANHAVEYDVVHSIEMTEGDRTRFNTNIEAEDAKSEEQMIATAAAAAKQIQIEKDLDVSIVFLLNDLGLPIVKLSYAPDQMDWRGVESTDSKFINKPCISCITFK
uniref:DUF4875 domain-containing protein n=1 Tax=Thaumasiovibrio occultus TaxID=1891184 RepID=UPI000B35A031|nr:hypothetical protein [Thaumasiovibrio occultus]